LGIAAINALELANFKPG